MAEQGDADVLGKKVFFLHPSALIQNQVIEELVQEEFEVYSTKDETKLRKLLKKYHDSIVFANISDGMKETAWEDWIKSVMADSGTAGVGIGIIASNDDTSLRYKYATQIKVSCGYTVVKPPLPPAIKQLVSVLHNANAKGRRKYLRAITEQEANITVNIPMNGTFVTGTIRDISAVGFSCSFSQDPELAKNSHIPDMQIRLKSQLLKVPGIVFGSRVHLAEKVYVILFTQSASPDIHTKIRKFIHSLLQSRIDSELK